MCIFERWTIYSVIIHQIIFLSSAEILFNDLPNKEIILSQIREIPISARSVERRITDLAEHVTIK